MSDKDEKEVKRRKQKKKMTKLLSKAWEMKGAEPFQQISEPESAPGAAFDLASIGMYLDETPCYYKLGRKGWERFSQDLGGVYNWHIQEYVLRLVDVALQEEFQISLIFSSRRKSSHAKTAKAHRGAMQQMIAKLDENLGKVVDSHIPVEGQGAVLNEKKRKKTASQASGDGPTPKKSKKIQDMTLSEREDRALTDLYAYIVANGGKSVESSHHSGGLFDEAPCC